MGVEGSQDWPVLSNGSPPPNFIEPIRVTRETQDAEDNELMPSPRPASPHTHDDSYTSVTQGKDVYKYSTEREEIKTYIP